MATCFTEFLSGPAGPYPMEVTVWTKLQIIRQITCKHYIKIRKGVKCSKRTKTFYDDEQGGSHFVELKIIETKITSGFDYSKQSSLKVTYFYFYRMFSRKDTLVEKNAFSRDGLSNSGYDIIYP